MPDKNKILIIDQDPGNRKQLSDFLSRHSFTIENTESISKASQSLMTGNTFSFLVARIPINEFHILTAIHEIKSFNPGLGVILMSNPTESSLAVSLLKKGIIDQITDPENHAAVYSALKNEITKRSLIKQNQSYIQRMNRFKTEQERNLKKAIALEEIYDSTLENLMTALDLRDVETFGHSRTVAKYSRVLAQLLGIKEQTTLDNIRKGALLHDIGKIAIPDSILKKPSPLSKWEWDKIKLHPALGYGLIKEIKMVKVVGNIILFHHERFDGNGYPKHLRGKDIPIEARIFALADALDAITSHRPYRKERDFHSAKNEIQKNAKTQFDPEVVDAFCSMDLEKWQKIRFESTQLLPFMEKMSHVSQESSSVN